MCLIFFCLVGMIHWWWRQTLPPDLLLGLRIDAVLIPGCVSGRLTLCFYVVLVFVPPHGGRGMGLLLMRLYSIPIPVEQQPFISIASIRDFLTFSLLYISYWIFLDPVTLSSCYSFINPFLYIFLFQPTALMMIPRASRQSTRTG